MKERRRARDIVRTQENARPRWEVRAEEEKHRASMKAATKVTPLEELPSDVQARHRASLRASGEKDD